MSLNENNTRLIRAGLVVKKAGIVIHYNVKLHCKSFSKIFLLGCNYRITKNKLKK